MISDYEQGSGLYETTVGHRNQLTVRIQIFSNALFTYPSWWDATSPVRAAYGCEPLRWAPHFFAAAACPETFQHGMASTHQTNMTMHCVIRSC